MKFLQKSRITHMRSFILMLGIALMSVNQAQSLDTIIAFSSDRDNLGGNRDIFVMMSDGSHVRNLTADPTSDDYTPAWSPDGRRIAFASVRNRNMDIYAMDAGGENLLGLTRDTMTDTGPSWSPDGWKIAFTTSRDGISEIYVMDADGRNPTNLTQHRASDVKLAWSPAQLAVSPKARLLTLWTTIKASH